LQLGTQQGLLHAANASGPQDVGSSGCNGMPDKKRSCSKDKCLVLAGDMVGLTCNDYCSRSGRTCLSAWEEVDNSCQQERVLGCDESYGTTSDLLCMCSPSLAPAQYRSLAAAQLVWSDEFDGSSVDTSKWGYVTGGGGFGNWELQHYTHHSAEVRDGSLRIKATCENYGNERFTSAKLTTENIADWGPGHRIEVRARAPSGKGTWPAIWMLPSGNVYGKWPASGEIDIMETVGCSPGKIYGTVHTKAYNHMRNTQAYGSLQLDAEQWHTYAIQWTQDSVQWFVDSELFGVFKPSHQDDRRWPFSQKFYLILNVAVGGSWGGSCLDNGRPSCSEGSDFQRGQVMEVDYARVYRL
jgi:hypothetical protein